MHAYNILDTAKYFIQDLSLPFFNSEDMVPIAVQTNLYPQASIFSFLLSFFNFTSLPQHLYIGTANLISITLYFLSFLALLIIIDKKKLRIISIMLFLVLPFGIPTLYEVFIKHPSSDSFVFFMSSSIIALAIYFLRTEDFKPLVFFISFSVVIRYYTALTSLIFILLLIVLAFFIRKQFFFRVIKSLKSKNNIVFLIFCFLISLSWPITTYHKYSIITPDFSSLNQIGLNENLNSKYSRALISSNVAESSSTQELKNSIINNNIYYKTFTNHSVEKTGIYLILDKIFLQAVF